MWRRYTGCIRDNRCRHRRIVLHRALTMTQQTKTTLKTYFETGDIPTETQFADLIDSAANNTIFDVRDYGALGDSATDDTDEINAAITAAVAVGGIVVFPPGTYRVTSPLAIGSAGITLMGLSGNTGKWGTVNTAATIDYRGSTAALSTATVSGVQSGITVENLIITGSNASAGTIGLIISDNGAGNTVTNVLIKNCTIKNFPSYQVKIIGGVVDVRFENVGLTNGSSSDHLVYADKGGSGYSPTQITLDNCFLVQATAAKWCIYLVRNCGAELRLFGGTITVSSTAAHGIHANPGISIFGTHLEGPSSSSGSSIGLQVSGSHGSFISPVFLATWKTGIIIGDPDYKADGAYNVIIAGHVTGNGTDVQILDGGERKGTVLLSLSQDAGIAPVISDLRYTTDGADEVTALYGYSNHIPVLARKLILDEGARVKTNKYLHFGDAEAMSIIGLSTSNNLAIDTGGFGRHLVLDQTGQTFFYGNVSLATNGGELLVGLTDPSGLTQHGSIAIAKDLDHRGTKLGFYGATTIARPTTSSGTAAFTANSGTAVNDASTFDGYTLKQVVKALRDLGLLT